MTDKLIRDIWKLAYQMTVLVKNSNAELDAAAFLGVLVAAPIWYYLLYQILVRVQATDLMFFLYWVYIPVALLGSVVTGIAKAVED